MQASGDESNSKHRHDGDHVSQISTADAIYLENLLLTRAPAVVAGITAVIQDYPWGQHKRILDIGGESFPVFASLHASLLQVGIVFQIYTLHLYSGKRSL